MIRPLLALLFLMGLSLRASTQGDAVSYLLSRANSLRASQGLPGYSLHPALSAAAANQARWMAQTGRVSHYQDDGSGPRQRAQAAGFPSSWVGENIYMGGGANPETAWNWWLGSPVHYAGIISPNYDMVGIGSAPGGSRTAFVMVFGNSSGRVAGGNSNAGSSAPAAPAYVLGLDEVGNIKHEVQPGQTLGDIALIYGYTWDDLEFMLEINGMTQDDIRYLQPGSVFLVPPKDGTFTPTSESPTPTATAPAAITSAPAATQAAPLASATSAPATSAPTREIYIARAPYSRPTPSPRSRDHGETVSRAPMLALALVIVLQIGMLGGAGIALLWRLR